MIVNNTQKIILETSYQSLGTVEKFIEEICDEHKVSQDFFGNILIAVTEAVNNAIQHGNKLDSSKKIELEFELNGPNLVFSVIDEGKGFDFNSIPDPTDPENLEKPNGRGVFLMRNLADKVEFLENGKIVNLSFKIE